MTMGRYMQPGKTASLMQLAAAVVGTAGAAQVIEPVHQRRGDRLSCPYYRDGDLELVAAGLTLKQHINACPHWHQNGAESLRRPPSEPSVTHYIVRGSGVTACCARNPLEMPVTDRLTDGTDGVPDEVDCPGLHTYQTEREPGVDEGPAELSVTGSNGRRLIARWTDEGVWLGGCLIADPEHVDALVSFITREDEGA